MKVLLAGTPQTCLIPGILLQRQCCRLWQVRLLPIAQGEDGTTGTATVSAANGGSGTLDNGAAPFTAVRVHADAPGAYRLRAHSAVRP